MKDIDKICLRCGRKAFADWIDRDDFKLIGVRQIGEHCMFELENNGETYEIGCQLGDSPEYCKYYMERVVLNGNKNM